MQQVALEAAYNECEQWLDAMLTYVWENYLYLKEFLLQNLPKVRRQTVEFTSQNIL